MTLMTSYMSLLKTCLVGHRGARGEAPENTLASFQVAVEAGVPEIELDVRLSADGHLIVVHDKEIDRTTWNKGTVQRYTRAELNLLDARRNTPGWHSATGIPSLSDVIQFCPPTMRFQFEVKTDTRAALAAKASKLKQLIDEMQLHDRVMVTSSDSVFLRMLGTISNNIKRGYVCQYRYLRPTHRARTLNCEWVIAHYSLINERMVRRAKRKGLRLSVWTVNDLNEAERLVALGVDSIITDFPTSFARHFESRVERMKKTLNIDTAD